MKVLIVDDDCGILNSLEEVIKFFRPEAKIILAHDGLEGLRALEAEEFDVLFSDVDMPRMGGLEMILKAQKKKIAPPVIILMSADPPDEGSELVKLLDIQTVLKKPFGIEKIQDILEGIERA